MADISATHSRLSARSAPPRKPAAAAAKPAAEPAKLAAAAGSATMERQASGNVAVMADGDLFGTTDRQRSGVRDAVPPTKKVCMLYCRCYCRCCWLCAAGGLALLAR